MMQQMTLQQQVLRATMNRIAIMRLRHVGHNIDNAEAIQFNSDQVWTI